MKAEYTAVVKKQGNSAWVLIPMMQMQVSGIRIGDAVKVTIEKIEDRDEGK